jgi:hypothetical protein
LALCQRKHVADKLKNAATIRINRMECDERSITICVAANCGPAGMKPAETFSLSTGDSEQTLRKPKPMDGGNDPPMRQAEGKTAVSSEPQESTKFAKERQLI